MVTVPTICRNCFDNFNSSREIQNDFLEYLFNMPCRMVTDKIGNYRLPAQKLSLNLFSNTAGDSGDYPGRSENEDVGIVFSKA